ncbi:carbohydrate-binding protein [Serratia sp. 1D1416]|uniref:carbohydrate-binding protein n=1 Tax=Serratia sp. 1D1416 TaxID=2447890 RepID=UPI001013D293|nr:glycosyl hydrolase family 18 protein [Serratia sp. 1D1416]
MKHKFKHTAIATSLLFCGLSSMVHAGTQDDASKIPDLNGKNILVGFWHNWASKSDGYQKGSSAEIQLSKVHADYNVVTVSFMTGDGIPTFKPYNMTDQAFRNEVAKLNAQDRAVLLSLGGADAHIQLAHGDAPKFANEIIRLVELYGFDGLDIDLEGGAITAGANVTEIPAALKLVKKKFPNFIISMAPEFPHLRLGGAYEKLIKNLEGYYDFISPQYYNQGGDGVSLDDAPYYLAQNNDAKKADFLFYLTDSIVHGTRGFVKIPADKFAIGLPSNPDAAATGYVKNESDVRTAMEKLAAQGTPIKGLMTWSINWDAGHDKSGNNYGNEFVNRYSDLIHNSPQPTPDIEAPTMPGKPQAKAAPDLINLHWSASTDNVGVAHYEIWRNGVNIAQSTAPEWQDKQIKPSTQYSYYIVAVDKANNRSEASESTQVLSEEKVKPVEDTEAPSIPQKLVMSKVAEKSASISWQASSDNVGVASYQIWRDGKMQANTTQLHWTDTGLKADSEYRYQITAKDAAGNQSEKSQTLVVKTLSESGRGDDATQWSNTKVYLRDAVVSWNGKNYKAKWWTQNNEPGASDVWENLDKESGGDWNAGNVYVGGDEVSYQGKTWIAKWWTKGDKPGASDVWKRK